MARPYTRHPTFLPDHARFALAPRHPTGVKGTGVTRQRNYTSLRDVRGRCMNIARRGHRILVERRPPNMDRYWPPCILDPMGSRNTFWKISGRYWQPGGYP